MIMLGSPMVGVLVAAVLTSIAAVHLAWALGTSWPAKSESELAQLVVGVGEHESMPPRIATGGVALLLIAMAIWILGAGEVLHIPLSQSLLRHGSWALAALFALRGAGGYVEEHFRPVIRGTPYARWNRILYSPLCLALAACILWAAGIH